MVFEVVPSARIGPLESEPMVVWADVESVESVIRPTVSC